MRRTWKLTCFSSTQTAMFLSSVIISWNAKTEKMRDSGPLNPTALSGGEAVGWSRLSQHPPLWHSLFSCETDKMLIEASESPILYASLSLCQTLFTLSDGRSHSEGWWIDLNTRQRVVCVAERHRLRQTGRAEGRRNEKESWTDMQSSSSCTWLTCKSFHSLSSQQINTDQHRRHVSFWCHLVGGKVMYDTTAVAHHS